jgi:O-antigen/teichoic acid export membrane protein
MKATRIQKIIRKLDSHTLEVAKKASKTMLVKMTGMAVGLFISIFLGRTLGPEGLGIINLANKLGLLLLVITMFGFQLVIVKHVSIANVNKNDKEIASKVKTGLIFNGSLALCIAIVGVLLLPFILNFPADNQDLYIPLLIAFSMLIPQSIARVYAAALNGLGKIWQANLVDKTLSFILVAIGLFSFWVFNVEFNVVNVLLLFGLSRVLLVIVVKLLWNNSFKKKVKGTFQLKPMLKMGLPLLLVSGTSIIASNADALMLGSLGTMKDVGLYSVAAILALLTSFFLQVTNTTIAPKMASLYDNSKLDEMQVMVSRVTNFLALIALLFIVFFTFFGNWLLGLWGTEFQDAYWILITLSIGQFVNIATGCSGMLLVMCGHEKIHGWISLTMLLLNISLNIIMIINFGALGAAIATASTVILDNLAKVFFAKKKIGILTLPKVNLYKK